MNEILKVCVCDDNVALRKYVIRGISKHLENRHDLEFFSFSDGKELLESEEDFNIIILDIEMNEINGIEVKNKLMTSSAIIIFLTGHSEYIKEGFGVNVLGFVEKKN